MKIIDLTHTISPNMPAYPGTQPPTFKVGCTIENDGFLEKEITMFSHTGTHIDAPAHLVDGLETLDQLQIDQYFGVALLLELEHLEGKTIDVKSLLPHEKQISEADFVLINTGWNKYWESEKYYYDYPVLSLEAAAWLSEKKLKGIGVDAISVDAPDSVDFPTHKIFFKEGMIVVENLVNLETIGCETFKFSCFPLNIQEADGSPVRAIAYLGQI